MPPRLDAKALYRALDELRTSRGMTWAEVARETGVSASTIRRSRGGGRMEVDGVLALAAWVGAPLQAFVRESRP